MKTPKSDLHLAALAAAALPNCQFVGTVPPRYRDDDIALCGLVDGENNEYLVIAALNASASLALTGNYELVDKLAKKHHDGVLPFDVHRARGTARMRDGGRAVVLDGFEGDLLATVISDELWPHPDWVEGLAAAAAHLHNLSTAENHLYKLPALTAGQIRTRLTATLDEAMATGKIPAELSGRWEEKLEDVSLWHFTPTIIHTNISPGSVFGKDGRVTGIIDWGDAQIGDPAEDLATIIPGVDAETHEAFFKAYRKVRRSAVDTGLEERTVFMTEFAVVRWLLHGISTHSEAVVADAVSMMEELVEEIRDDSSPGSLEDAALDTPYDDDASDELARTGAIDRIDEEEEIATEALKLER